MKRQAVTLTIVMLATIALALFLASRTPVIAPGTELKIVRGLRLSDDDRTLTGIGAQLTIIVPEGWSAAPLEGYPNEFELKPDDGRKCSIKVSDRENLVGSPQAFRTQFNETAQREGIEPLARDLVDIANWPAANFSWRLETGVLVRQVVIPHGQNVVGLVLEEDPTPADMLNPPVPCEPEFDALLASGITL